MKKIIIPILILLLIGLTISIYYNISNKKEIDELKEENKKYQEEIKEYKGLIDDYENKLLKLELKYGKLTMPAVEKISYKEYLNKRGKEKFILIITMTGCSHCELYLPKIDEVLAEYNITGYNLDMALLTEQEWDNIRATINFEGTPTTVIFNNDGSYTTIEGNKDPSTIRRFIKENYYEK